MRLLFSTVKEVALVSCSVSGVFFGIGWVLQRPVVKNLLNKQITRFLVLKEAQREEVVNGVLIRAVGTVHNVVQIVLALWALKNPVLWGDTWHGVTPLSQLIAVISTGYFLWDTASSIPRITTDGAEFLLHGVLSFAFYAYVACTNNFHFYGCSFLLWEISTPLVQFRWFLYKVGLKESKLYLYNGVLMIIVFGIFRILWGGYLGVKYFASSMTPQQSVSPVAIWALRLNCLLLNGLNWYWFSKMVGGATKLLFKRSTPRITSGVTEMRSNGIKEY